MSVSQIAEKEGKHVIDAMLDLSVADDLRTEWAGPVENALGEEVPRRRRVHVGRAGDRSSMILSLASLGRVRGSALSPG